MVCHRNRELTNDNEALSVPANISLPRIRLFSIQTVEVCLATITT